MSDHPRKFTKTLYVQFYRDAQRQWRWRSKSNGNILSGSTQGYSRRVDAVAALERELGGFIQWLYEERAVKHGQVPRLHDVVEVTILKLYVEGAR